MRGAGHVPGAGLPPAAAARTAGLLPRLRLGKGGPEVGARVSQIPTDPPKAGEPFVLWLLGVFPDLLLALVTPSANQQTHWLGSRGKLGEWEPLLAAKCWDKCPCFALRGRASSVETISKESISGCCILN